MSITPAAVPSDEASIAETASSDLTKLRRMVLGLFLIAACCALYFARDFFMPVVLAFLIALTLTPIVRFLRKRGVPSALSATLLVIAFATLFALLAYLVSGPAITLVNDAPSIGRTLAERLRHVQRPLDRVNEAMDALAGGTALRQLITFG